MLRERERRKERNEYRRVCPIFGKFGFQSRRPARAGGVPAKRTAESLPPNKKSEAGIVSLRWWALIGGSLGWRRVQVLRSPAIVQCCHLSSKAGGDIRGLL